MSGKTKTTNPLATQQYNTALSSLGGKSYTPVTGQQIQSYIDPFTSSVIDATTARNNQNQSLALNDVRDQATRAGAFGGSGQQVAEALTRGQFDLNNQNTAAALNAANYGQALQVAQGENGAANQYPLAIQALLGQLAGQTGTVQKSPTDWGAILQGLGSAASGAAMLSDRRLKRDIVPLGERAGRKWYQFRYLWSDDVHEGVMAQENMDIALEGPGGFLMVDYGAI